MEREAEQLDKLLRKLKERRQKGRLLKKEEILELLSLKDYDELMVFKAILTNAGFIATPTKDTIGTITDEGIAFITMGGFSQTQLKKAPDITVFISYSSEDSKDADNIAMILEELDIKYFRDKKDINWGDNIPGTIKTGLSECTDLVVIISRDSLKSPWVSFEIGGASALNMKILPFLTDPSLEGDLPLYLKNINYTNQLRDIKSYFESRLR
jgi:hypothetical protein